MSTMLARILLAMALVAAMPCCAIGLFLLMENRVFRADWYTLLTAMIGSAAIFVSGWVLLWRSTVRWSSVRVMLTVASVFWSTGSAILLSFLIYPRANDEFLIILSSLAWLPLWMVSTLLIWRERDADRALAAQARPAGHVSCPKCGYDLAGLREARCPECGTQYTLDQLMAAAHEREPLGVAGSS